MEDHDTILGYQTLYPGSHELRPIALVPAEETLASEGLLVVARLERKTATDRGRSHSRPEETVALLFELGASLTRQAELAKLALSMIAPQTE